MQWQCRSPMQSLLHSGLWKSMGFPSHGASKLRWCIRTWGKKKKKKRSKQVSRNTWEFSWLRCKCSPVLWLLMAFLFRKRSGFVYILCFITLRSVNKFKDSVNVRAHRITSIYFHSTSQSTAVWHHVSFIGGVMLMCSPCSNLSCSVKVKNSRWGSFDQM